MERLITSIDQLTPSRLTEIFRGSGFLPVGDVRSLVVTRVHTEQLGSISYFLRTTYTPAAPPDAPARLFLKLPREADPPDRIDASTGLREVRMYQALAPDQHLLPVVPCYDAHYDFDRRRYHLLLADLSESHEQPAWHLSIAEHYVTRTVDCLARFHAYWWEHPRLLDGPASLTDHHQIASEITAVQNHLPAFVDALGDQFSAADRRAYELLLAALPRLWSTRTSPDRKTIAHGDAHFWNLLYARDPAAMNTAIVDWQLYHVGVGLQDLAYTLVLRYPHRTAANERAFVERYHRELLRHGVGGYSWDDCWYDYRRHAAEQLLFPLRWQAGGLPRDFWSLFVPRALAGFRELACVELL